MAIFMARWVGNLLLLKQCLNNQNLLQRPPSSNSRIFKFNALLEVENVYQNILSVFFLLLLLLIEECPIKVCLPLNNH
jgi:hypothetical protein